jgi:hypothetical protein
MDYFLKNYIDACKIEFAQYGFKRKSKAFVRVVNDVMQGFAIEKFNLSRECKVLYSILPLCLGIEQHYISGGVYSQELSKFEPWGTWCFEPKSEKSMNECIKYVISQIHKHLIPLFNKADSCKTAYHELCEADRLFDKNRKIMLENRGIEYIAEHEYIRYGVNMLDNVKYYMALKNGNYDVAVDHLKAMEKQNANSYSVFLSNKPNFDDLVESRHLTEKDRLRWEENRQTREKSLANLRVNIEAVAAHDEIYIQGIINENEAYSLNNLGIRFPGWDRPVAPGLFQ